jgi:hypothetical protein
MAAGHPVADQTHSQPESPDFPRPPLLPQYSLKTMADNVDMMAMMGITGFGKQTKKRELDPNRFEKNRREEVCLVSRCAQFLISCLFLQGRIYPCHTSYGIGATQSTG